MKPLGTYVERLLRVPRLDDHVLRVGRGCDKGAVAIDLGCGDRSPVPAWAPHLHWIGVEAESPVLQAARAARTHDEYVRADLSHELDRLQEVIAGRDVQLVCMIHVIEHLPRRVGEELLDALDTLSERSIVVETPNRFQPQGPEYGSEAQRHLSGWFAEDFIGRGYNVYGTAGTRYLRGYAGHPRVRARGGHSLDFLLARGLMVERFPSHAYNLVAVKDVRGVPARLA